MLNYTEAQRPAFKLAEHYSDRLQNPLFAGFILGKEDIHSSTHPLIHRCTGNIRAVLENDGSRY